MVEVRIDNIVLIFIFTMCILYNTALNWLLLRRNLNKHTNLF